MPLSTAATPSGSVKSLVASVDWSKSPLGEPASWPENLKTIFAMMLASPAQIVLFWGPEYVALYNDAYAPTIGNKHPHALGRPAIENWGELWDDLKALLDRVRTTGEPVYAKDRPFYIERRGVPEQVTFDIAYSAVEDAAGKAAGVLCIVNETTARLGYERQLRESEGQLKAITNSIEQMIWSTRPDGYHDYYNDRWYEFTGVPLGSTDGEEWKDMFHPDDREHAWAIWRRSLETGEPYRIEYRLRHKSGAYRWVIGRANCVRDSEGRITRWYGSCTDIHEIKTAEMQRQAVLELQEEIRTFTDPAEIAYASAAMLGKLMGVSRAGYGTIDPVAETITIEKDWNAEGIKSLAGTLKFRDFGSYIDELKRGETVIFADAEIDPRTRDTADALKAISAQSVVNMPITEQNGLVALLYLNNASKREWPAEEIAFIREVAERTRQAVERRRAENELRELTVALERQVNERTAALMKSEEQLRQAQKMEAVGQLTGGIAHDFNNMLAVIIGGLNLMQRRLKRGETDVQRFIDGAMEGAERAATLTQRLLAFSRRQPLSPEPIDANRMIAGMSELLLRSLGEHIRIETITAAGLWRTKADLAQLESALLNLAVNARDAMVEGGKLTIETANTHVDDVYGRKYEIEPGQYVVIAVTDTGVGMPPDVLDRAFEPFFTTKGVGKGSGLGLSQVFGFVRQSGGHVKIYSEIGVGTTVKIYLPRFYGDVSETEAAVPPSSYTGQGETILLVEDEDRVRSFTAEVLRDLGYNVITASGGPEALRMLENGFKASLLFTDVVMPDMTGRQLVDAALKIAPDMKVLYATGYTRNAVVHNGIVDPGTNFLEKPFSVEKLALKIRTILDKAE